MTEQSGARNEPAWPYGVFRLGGLNAPKGPRTLRKPASAVLTLAADKDAFADLRR